MRKTDKVRNLLHSVNCFFHPLACLPMLVMICLLSLVTLSPALCATINYIYIGVPFRVSSYVTHGLQGRGI